jgi:hydroxymethylpyrimidine/phosphomethylpyrimidine kinase
MQPIPCILTIAGSDSGGGAGIQADLKTISMLGGYGASVITALTAQNTTAVTGIHAPDPAFVAEQLKTVTSDIPVRAAKTGMLFSAPIIKALGPHLAAKDYPLVVDPVCVAQSGAKLLEDDAVDAMVEHVFPHADLLTPNIPEAELFTGISIHTSEDMVAAAEKLLTMGPKAVLIKGGHMDSVTATDWLAQPGVKPMPLIMRRVKTENNHGTGCTLSAAIATGLGFGLDLCTAVRNAQQYLNLALRASFSLGAGSGPPNHLAPWLRELSRPELISELDGIGRRVSTMSGFEDIIPECRMNVTCAVPHADCSEDMAAFTGGVVASRKGAVMVAGYPSFGASVRVSSALCEARRRNGDLHWAMNLRGGADILSALKKAGIRCLGARADAAWFDGRPGDLESRVVEAAWPEEGLAEGEDVGAVACESGAGHPPMVWLFAPDSSTFLSRICGVIDCLKSAESL